MFNFGEDHIGLIPHYNNLGVINKKLGESKEAIICYKKSLEVIQKNGGVRHALRADILFNMSILFEHHFLNENALNLSKKAFVNYESAYGRSH